MQNNSELFKSSKYQNNAVTFQKKINQQIQPKNMPKGQTIELIVDVVSDKVCLFVKKDNKNYENIFTNFTEKDIVNFVNQSPEVIIRNTNIVLKYDEKNIIELKNVPEFTSLQSRSPMKVDNQEAQEVDTEAMELEIMYEKLNLQYVRSIIFNKSIFRKLNDINKMKETNQNRLEQVTTGIQQIKDRLAEIEQLKKEQQDPSVIQIFEIKMQVFGKELTRLQEFGEIVKKLESENQSINQLFYLKTVQLFQVVNKKFSQYATQKDCLEKQLTILTDDLRRFKLRKQAKDQEECEKKIEAMASDFSNLETMPFLIDPFTMIDYKFLSCDETDIYKNDIINLSQEIEQCQLKSQLANQQIELEQKEFENYQIGIDQIQEEMMLNEKENQELLQQLSDVKANSKEILIWKDKYNQLSQLIKELQSKHAIRVQQLEQHLQIKGNEINEMKMQLQKKTFDLEEQKKIQGEIVLDSKSLALQEEINKLKSKNSQLELKVSKLQSEVQKRKEEENFTKNEIQQARQQLNELKINEQQVMEQLAAQEVTRKELEKFQQKNEKKFEKQAILEQKVKNRQREIQELQMNIKGMEDNIQKLKQEFEKVKAQSNKKDSEIKNCKLRLDLNVKQ